MTTYAVFYGRATHLKHIRSYDNLNDAVACAIKEGVVFNDNTIEEFQQSNKRIVFLHIKNSECVICIERI